MASENVAFIVSETKYQKSSSRRTFICVIVVLLAIIVGFLIGYFSRSTSSKKCTTNNQRNDTVPTKLPTKAEQLKFFKTIVDSLDANNIRKNLKYFSRKPHAASTPRNNELIREIHRRFQVYGFDASYHKYDVLLSFPSLKKRNYVYVIDNNGSELFKSKGIEDFLESAENDSTALPPFNAYGPNGTVEGELVYVNYGRYEDFEELETKYNMNCTGKIVIARYGKIFRGDKVKNAQDRGAIGVIIYSDPFDYSPVADEKLFPHGRWLPKDGVQRGSIGKGSYKDLPEGDFLTGGYPAKDWVYRTDPSTLEGLPHIPTQPVSAYDAYHLLKGMGGPVVESSWTGALNITYRIGPYKNTSQKVKVVVNNERKICTISNVCGTVKGRVEPDRYVLLGNHVDAWVFGAVDPSSGTAVMMEIARALGERIKTGWKPRRTIKLCGWDGEESGLIGSDEFVEEFRSQLRDRAVAYINIDSAVAGNDSLKSGASPLLHQLMFDVHKLVSDPVDAGMTVFDKCKIAYKDKNYPEEHYIGSLGSGSDYFSFYQFIGIPSIDISYRQPILNKRMNASFYPMYHSLHDTFYWMEKFVDREFKVHLTVARVGAYYLLHLAELPIISMDVQRYSERLEREVSALAKVLKNKGGDAQGVSTDPLHSAAKNFSSAASAFKNEMSNTDKENSLKLRMMNDRLTQMEKGFIYLEGLPGRPYVKHYIMAPSLHNSYGSSTFPAIADLLYDIHKTKNWNAVKKQITITAYLIQAVAQSLASPV